MSLLSLENVSRSYAIRRGWLGRSTAVRAVEGVSLDVAAGRTLGVVGESGCGKSTTGRLALGLERPDTGSVHFDGAPMPAPDTPAWRSLRARMQLVPQDPLAALDRRLPIARQIGEPLLIHGQGGASERRDRVEALLHDVGLFAEHGRRYPHALSGGQRQRAVLARALATGPELLVCDEPVSALDVSIQAQIVNLLVELQSRRRLAMLFISHDLRIVRQVSHEVAVMYLGRVVERGDPDAVFAEPAHPYAQALVAAIPGSRVARTVLQGDPPRPGGAPLRLPVPSALPAGRASLPGRDAGFEAAPQRRPPRRLPCCAGRYQFGTSRMISRRLLLSSSMAALPLVALAQAEQRPSLTIAVQKIANSGTLEPLREQSSNASEHYLLAMLETPILRDQQHGLGRIPGLASSWRRIDDRTVELELRPGVRFHDGSTMTAEDVAWNFGPERMFGPALPPDAVAVARRHWPALDRVEATGPLTVRFINKTPDITMEGRLSAGGSEIVSPRSFRSPWIEYARAPSGTGPYKLREFRPDVSLILDAHDGYWGGRPPCRSLRFLEVPEAAARVNGLLSGEYDLASDILPDQIAAIDATSRFDVRGGPVNNHRIVNFDMHHPALADPRVRLAMAHAIDGRAIVDSLWAGRTTVPPGLQFPFYGPMLVPGWSVPATDPAEAKRLLAAAGYKGEPIPYRIRNDYYVAETATAQVLLAMWEEVGLNVQLAINENWSQVLAKTPQRGLRDWSNSATFDDPVSSIVNQEGPDGAQQQVGEWTNAEMNRLCGEMTASTDMGARQKMFARMLAICEREDPAYIVLHQNAAFTAARKTLHWPGTGSFYVDLSPRGLPG